MARPKKSAPRRGKPSEEGGVRLYTLEVFLITALVTEKFARKNPVVLRVIQIRGDQTLEDLHHTIFDAFGRWDEHMYEFQFGKKPMDRDARRFVVPTPFELDLGLEDPPAGRADEASLDSLGLVVGQSFFYWFDFGDDWWHKINVLAIDEKAPRGKFPKVTKREGESPPQYPDYDEDEEEED